MPWRAAAPRCSTPTHRRARPPAMNRFPFQRPLSRFTGATPTKAAATSLAGQRAQLRQVRQQRPARPPGPIPGIDCNNLRPWPSTPDSPRSPGPTPRPPSRSPSPERRRIASMLRRTERPAVVQPVRLHRASRLRTGCVGPPAACNSWVWAPASWAAPVVAHPLGEFGQRTWASNASVLGASAQRPRQEVPLPAWGSPGSPEGLQSKSRDGGSARYPPVASITMSVGANGSSHAIRAVMPAGDVVEPGVRCLSGPRCVRPARFGDINADRTVRVGVVALRSRGVVRSRRSPRPGDGDLKGRVTVRGLHRGTARRGFTLTHGREGLRGIELTRRWTPE